MTTEEKALALVNEARQFCTSTTIVDTLCRELAEELERAIEREQAAIEAHEADNARNEQRLADQAKAFSDAARKALSQAVRAGTTAHARAVVIGDILSPFILPEPEPDPLVEARRQIADRVLRQYGAPASDEDCIGLIVAALEEQAKIERIEQ